MALLVLVREGNCFKPRAVSHSVLVVVVVIVVAMVVVVVVVVGAWSTPDPRPRPRTMDGARPRRWSAALFRLTPHTCLIPSC